MIKAPALNSSGCTETPKTTDTVWSSTTESTAQFQGTHSVSPKTFAIRRKPTQDASSSRNKVNRERHSACETVTSTGDVPTKVPDHLSKMWATPINILRSSLTFLCPDLLCLHLQFLTFPYLSFPHQKILPPKPQRIIRRNELWVRLLEMKKDP